VTGYGSKPNKIENKEPKNYGSVQNTYEPEEPGYAQEEVTGYGSKPNKIENKEPKNYGSVQNTYEPEEPGYAQEEVTGYDSKPNKIENEGPKSYESAKQTYDPKELKEYGSKRNKTEDQETMDLKRNPKHIRPKFKSVQHHHFKDPDGNRKIRFKDYKLPNH